MPKFDYACDNCDFEVMVECKMSDREVMWPECCGAKMQALITNNQKHTDNTTYRKGTGGKDWR